MNANQFQNIESLFEAIRLELEKDWSYTVKAPPDKIVSANLIGKLESNGYQVEILHTRCLHLEKCSNKMKCCYRISKIGRIVYYCNHRCTEHCNIQEFKITQPEAEADALISYIEAMWEQTKKPYYIISFPKGKNLGKTVIRKLKEKGYHANSFIASCYHKAHCDTTDVKCKAFNPSNPDDGTYCNHRCNDKCKEGAFIKIKYPEPDVIASMLSFL